MSRRGQKEGEKTETSWGGQSSKWPTFLFPKELCFLKLTCLPGKGAPKLLFPCKTHRQNLFFHSNFDPPRCQTTFCSHRSTSYNDRSLFHGSGSSNLNVLIFLTPKNMLQKYNKAHQSKINFQFSVLLKKLYPRIFSCHKQKKQNNNQISKNRRHPNYSVFRNIKSTWISIYLPVLVYVKQCCILIRKNLQQ